MTCNYNKNLPHIQILSHPKSKIGNFSSSNPKTTDYAKSTFPNISWKSGVAQKLNGQKWTLPNFDFVTLQRK